MSEFPDSDLIGQLRLANQPHTVLVVDDVEMNRDLLSRRLQRQGYQVAVAENGLQAIEMLSRDPIDLILLDIMMPEMDGYQVLGHLKQDERLKHIPVIMITALNEIDSVVRCIEMGAEDYLPKPFNPVLLQARVNASLERKRSHDMKEEYRQRIEDHNRLLEHLVNEQVQKIAAAQFSTLFAMSKLAESRDPETGKHLERIREYCKALAENMASAGPYRHLINVGYVANLYSASPLHDIGKVGIPDRILQKPGKLDADEWKIMQTHASIGADTLRAVLGHHPDNQFLHIGIEIAEGHHEKWDGSGYPFGLRGQEIPLSARILALADVYDALTTQRCYKPPFPHDQVTEMIVAQSGKHFDPVVVSAFETLTQDFNLIRTFHSDPDE